MASTRRKLVRDAIVAKLKATLPSAEIYTAPVLLTLQKPPRVITVELVGPFVDPVRNELISGNVFQGHIWRWEISFMPPARDDHADEIADEVFELLEDALAPQGPGFRPTAACGDMTLYPGSDAEGPTGFTQAGFIYTAQFTHDFHR